MIHRADITLAFIPPDADFIDFAISQILRFRCIDIVAIIDAFTADDFHMPFSY